MGISNRALSRISSYLPRVSSEDEIEGPLFHVTFYSNLEGIKSSGLTPGAGFGVGIGSEAYSSHASKGVFLTDEAGISFWFGRSQSFAEDRSDNTYESGHTPVILKIDPLPEDFEYLSDEIGSRDSRSEAFIYPGTIGPEFIQVWFDGSWAELEDVDNLDPMSAYDIEETDSDPLYWFKTDSDNPLYYNNKG